MALTKIQKTGVGADAIDATKIADDAISEEHLDITAITGNAELTETANDSDVLLIYDASAGTLKKILKSNLTLQVPSISSVSPTNVVSGDGTGNATFTITGTGFDGTATAVLITNGGSEVAFDTVTRDSSTQITAVIAISSLSNANEPHDVKVTNSSGLSGTLTNQINIDAQPVFNTASGSIGSFAEQSTISTIDIEAYDPDSAGNVTFEIQSGSLPAGLTATTVNENGVSKYRITGTLTTDVSSSTTTNFTLRAVDAASNTSSRAFSITEIPTGVQSFTSSGTFSVPTGITSVDVLVVAGGASGGKAHGSSGTGGGGAGGLIYRPGFTVTPGGTVSVTVGCGGAPQGQPNGTGNNGQDSVFGTLTAKGGGGGGAAANANSGGSGGGGSVSYAAAQGIQPTQPGQSGAYGFGNAGGGPGGPTGNGGGGGGGAGAVGSAGSGTTGGVGGIGKAYTIADGTTSVYYAGGGGGNEGCSGTAGQGGQGGGTAGGGASPGSGNATANRGGGTGGVRDAAPGSGTGGKGIVIVRY